jgi:uncharacterized membrane protein
MNSKYKKILIAAVLILIALNVVAFYVLQKGIGIAEAIKNTENKEALNSLEQKQVFSDVFPSLVFTIDIALIFLVCYLLIKMLFKSLKKSTSNK